MQPHFTGNIWTAPKTELQEGDLLALPPLLQLAVTVRRDIEGQRLNLCSTCGQTLPDSDALSSDRLEKLNFPMSSNLHCQSN